MNLLVIFSIVVMATVTFAALILYLRHKETIRNRSVNSTALNSKTEN